ncbi:hypothetical protein Pint_32406 [Pistacia integerrima]|uniref:Uncharacterized protein n=1 Tax=Pistacia integerrima TaxID=434235 RepID=A0ACC0XNC2_9ROSI|nr:hypothetical protein Pint_32406 [Pistacia integerrima]
MYGLMKENSQVNSKVLSELSMHELSSFRALVDISRDAFPGTKTLCFLPERRIFRLMCKISFSDYSGFSIAFYCLSETKQSGSHINTVTYESKFSGPEFYLRFLCIL